MPAKKTKRKIVSAEKRKNVSIKKSAGRNAAAGNGKTERKSRFLIYLYWVVIALFVGMTCHMLSRAGKNKAAEKTDNVEITESSAPASGAPRETDPEADRLTDSGKQKLLKGDTVGALNDFTMAIEKNPSSLNFTFRGEVWMEGSNFEAAISDFDAAIRIDPEYPVAYYDRALANIKLEKLDNARTDLDLAIQAQGMSPDDARDIATRDIYAKRAQVNLWLRDWTAAEDDYTAAISETDGELDWNDYTGRAEARTNKGDYKNAISDYVSAVTIISEKIQKTPDEKTRENMSRQAMGFFEKSGALRVKIGEMDLALQDLQAAHTLAIALNDTENKNRLEILISSIR
jgi:tetratricopeptide (TPR) repeat protein